MSYIESQMGPKEKIIFRGQIHKIIFWFPAVCTLLWLFCIRHAFWALVLIALWTYCILKYVFTEAAITSRQLIAKQGIISVDSAAVELSAIEGVRVYIPLLGRILGYGTLVVSGRGGQKIGIPYLTAPEVFKRKLYQAVEMSKN